MNKLINKDKGKSNYQLVTVRSLSLRIMHPTSWNSMPKQSLWTGSVVNDEQDKYSLGNGNETALARHYFEPEPFLVQPTAFTENCANIQ